MRIDKYIKKRNTNTRKFTQIHIKLLLITNSIDTYRKTQSNLNMCDYQKRNENIARIANAVPVTLYSRDTMNVEIVVLNCHKCNQCLKGHKSRGLVFEGVL